MNTLPTLFVSHGAPTFALQPGQAGALLGALGNSLPRPDAVLVVSPHWMPGTLQVTAAERPETIHDFSGFPPALYELQYPAAGAPQIAAEVIATLAAAGIPAQANATRGLDHGAWVPLRFLYPAADVPVPQLSLPRSRNPHDFLALGRALAPLRTQGVLVVGSGSVTHNLGDFRGERDADEPYVAAFAGWLRAAIAAGDLDALLDYRARAPHAQRAHPTDEHLMPLLVALGAAGEDWRASRHLDGGVDYGMLAMDAYLFGVGDDTNHSPPITTA
jgi:4,5-DOPA dioxygenase extradiol